MSNRYERVELGKLFVSSQDEIARVNGSTSD
jgi:hypothetical protein